MKLSNPGREKKLYLKKNPENFFYDNYSLLFFSSAMPYFFNIKISKNQVYSNFISKPIS